MTDYRKLLKFSKLMGVEVVTMKSEEDAGAFVYGKEPVIEMSSKGRKGHYITIVLLHELGHALDWAQMGRPRGREIPKALAKDEDKLTPADCRIIYEYECRAIENMKLIYQILDLKLPLWKLERERRFDKWIAQTLLERGEYPPVQERERQRRQLKRLVTRQSVSNLSLI